MKKITVKELTDAALDVMRNPPGLRGDWIVRWAEEQAAAQALLPPIPIEWHDARFNVGDLVRVRETQWPGIITDVSRGPNYGILPKNKKGKYAWFRPCELELIETGPWETMMS
jgi:hypothetical protein